ncbi:hypothetical protein SAMN04488564_12410 [Lentzea waywayandensis]|uniref:Uncharacterized protein n=1 Tax=Lentzea waywayandensis TaxID=84724 RepID=A0A1I6FJD4_9PSEU|nr:hypothetical protein [Lentzea waywayandensis]SFR29917.1 hypothetical protein SAMN04488564_12410 [Lentzea waywayandensis]
MAKDKPPGTVIGEPPDGAQHPMGHGEQDFKGATKQEDGSWVGKYENGDTVIWSGDSSPPKPDPDWKPDTSNTQLGDPWDIHKGNHPPLPPAPKVPGGTETPGKGVKVINVDAIKLYANNIRSLKRVITQAIKELDDLATRGFGAGNFGAANNFKSKVFGGASGKNTATLLESTRQVFVEAETIIDEVSARCFEIAQKYKTADELTELDVKEFSSMVGSVKAKVSNLPLGAAS